MHFWPISLGPILGEVDGTQDASKQMKEPKIPIKKPEHFRTIARGYKALKKDKAAPYEAAAEALERMEKRSDDKKRQ
jgi:hypothetical protein